MGVIVNKEKCFGCAGLDEPRCVKACPGDLMALDKASNKSYIREDRDCWDCMCCIKACPVSAIDIKLPYQIADYKATLKPKCYADRIHWTLVDINGKVEEFDIQTKVAK